MDASMQPIDNQTNPELQACKKLRIDSPVDHNQTCSVSIMQSSSADVNELINSVNYAINPTVDPNNVAAATANTSAIYDYAAMYAASGLSEEKDTATATGVAGVNKTKPCTKFFSTSGCPYGESCHFLHFVPGMNQNPNLAMSKLMTTALGTLNDPSLTVNGYKTRLCNRFNTPEGCRFNENCHFAHGESDIRRPASQLQKLAVYGAVAAQVPAVQQPHIAPGYGYLQTADPGANGTVITTAINYTADGSAYAMASASAAYATGYPYSAYPPQTAAAPAPANYSAYPPNYANYAANYAAVYPAATNYVYGDVNYAYTVQAAQAVQAPVNVVDHGAAANQQVQSLSPANTPTIYCGEPTPPGVTVVPPPMVHMPVASYEAPLTA